MHLEFDDVAVTVAGNILVSELSLTVGTGELVGLVGPNGSGKSSTLRAAFRMLTPSAGRIRLGEHDLHELSLRQSARHLAALPQESQAEFDYTVSEVVAMGRTPHGGGENDPVCRRSLDEVGCAHLAERGFQSLSGGEKQRVLIARALAQQPDVLVLDEPTNHLDIRNQLEVLTLVRTLGPSTLTALHDLNLAASWCDRVYVLDAGSIVASGPPREALTPSVIRAVFGVEVHIVDHPTTGVPQLLFESAPNPSESATTGAQSAVAVPRGS